MKANKITALELTKVNFAIFSVSYKIYLSYGVKIYDCIH
jgi:hypothetical protein